VAPTPAAFAACGFARTVIGAFGDTGGLEPARTLLSCPAHTPCPLGGRAAAGRVGGSVCRVCSAPAGLVCRALRSTDSPNPWPEPARTLSSCPAHTPCPLGGRSAPDRVGGSACRVCAPPAVLVCPARR